MEFEALLFGLEPAAALAAGLGALAITPVIAVVDSATGSNLSESTKDVAKKGLVWAMEVYDKTESTLAEAGESVQDLIAEARAEVNQGKNGDGKNGDGKESSPKEIKIAA
ncbi:MAG: DUF5132 domain-containing protein [Xenococcaceae cyanobacterium]